MRAMVLWFLMTLPAFAGGEKAGRFDYYVLALGWSPTWCALVGEARGEAQCDAGRNLGFTLHGLWPQYENGWPSDCRSGQRDPSRAETAAMADLMGSSGLAWHEWKKHGRCSGLSAADYYAEARQAYEKTMIPDYFAKLPGDVRISAPVVEDAFMQSNPGLTRDMITVDCEQGRISGLRICLSKDLTPRPCPADTAQDCQMTDALMEKMR